MLYNIEHALIYSHYHLSSDTYAGGKSPKMRLQIPPCLINGKTRLGIFLSSKTCFLGLGLVTGSPIYVNSPNSRQSGSTPIPDFFVGVRDFTKYCFLNFMTKTLKRITNTFSNIFKLILDQYATSG